MYRSTELPCGYSVIHNCINHENAFLTTGFSNSELCTLSCPLTKTLVLKDFEPDHTSYSHLQAGSLLQKQDQICITIVKPPHLCLEHD